MEKTWIEYLKTLWEWKLLEHLKPQTMDGVDPLDFMNMLCSCQKNIKRGEPLHCGNLKADWYEQELFITPFDPACESRFHYTGDGRITPSNNTDKAAEKTIEKLGLNIPKLRDLRKQVIDTFFEDNLSGDDFSEYIAGYLQQDQKGQYSEFWTTVLYISIHYN